MTPYYIIHYIYTNILIIQQVDGHKKEERMLEMISLTTTTQELHNRGLNLENDEDILSKLNLENDEDILSNMV